MDEERGEKDERVPILKGVLGGCVLRLFLKRLSMAMNWIQSLKEMGFDKIVAGTIYPLLQKLEKQRNYSWGNEAVSDGPDREFFP